MFRSPYSGVLKNSPGVSQRPAATLIVVCALALVSAAACTTPAPEDDADVTTIPTDWLGAPADTPTHEYDLLPVDQRDGWLELVADMVIEERAGDTRYSFGEAPPTLALHDDGRLFVHDAGNYRVVVFSPDGEFLYQFGSRGQGPGEFNRDARGPIGFLDGRLFVSYDYRRIGFWTPEGHMIEGTESRLGNGRMVPQDDGTLLSSAIVREINIRQVVYTVARFAVTPDGLEEKHRYTRVPAGLRPQFAGLRSGEAYVSTIGPGTTQITAFTRDGEARWITHLQQPPGTTVMPSDLMTDAGGRVFVMPRLNRPEELPPPVTRSVDVLAADGTHIAAAKIPDLEINIMWQQARDEFVFGVQADPDTHEWQVVRYRLQVTDG